MTPLLVLLLTALSPETLNYNLTWIAVSGGTMRLSIAPDDAKHYRITSVAQTSKSFALIYSARDEITSTVNRDDFSTVRYEKHLAEGGKHKDDTTVVDEAQRIATRHRPNKIDEKVRVPKPVFDPLSIVYRLRDVDLTPGKVHRFNVVADGKLYTIQARVKDRERVETDAGTFNTVVVEPEMTAGGLFKGEGTLTIWYTDDARHIPVKIRSEVKVGAITATLRSISK